MKIAQINCTYGVADSTGRNTMELHRYFMQNGHESCVYAARINDGSNAEHVTLFSSQRDMRIHGLLSRLMGKQGFFSKKTTAKLLKALDAQAPDVVILGVLHSNCICLPMLFDYLAKKKVPTVLVLHDCWYYTGHCCHYTEIGCGKWKEHCGACAQIHQWNKSWFFDHSKSILQQKSEWYSQLSKLAVVGVSDWIANEARQSVLKNADVIRRIYNWIDLETFKPQNTDELRKELGILPTEKVLLGVASAWGERKGLAEMQLAAKIPNTKVILVGGVPEGMEQPRNMICVGKIKNAEKLAQYYALADVFLNPSVQETFGKTTAEALSCGTPVVVYDTTACPELVGEACGSVVKLGEKKEYVKAVCDILNGDKYVHHMSCRKYAEEQFSFGECLLDYQSILEEIVKHRKF